MNTEKASLVDIFNKMIARMEQDESYGYRIARITYNAFYIFGMAVAYVIVVPIAGFMGGFAEILEEWW